MKCLECNGNKNFCNCSEIIPGDYVKLIVKDTRDLALSNLCLEYDMHYKVESIKQNLDIESVFYFENCSCSGYEKICAGHVYSTELKPVQFTKIEGI